MKVKQEDEQVNFKPITLTIETKDELLVMLSLLGSVGNAYVNEITSNNTGRSFAYEAYCSLQNIARGYGITSHKYSTVKVVKDFVSKDKTEKRD